MECKITRNQGAQLCFFPSLIRRIKARYREFTGIAALVALCLFPVSAHAGPFVGEAILLIIGIGGYLVFLGITALFAFVGLIRGVLRYRRGGRSVAAVILATVFLVPNIVGVLVYFLFMPPGSSSPPEVGQGPPSDSFFEIPFIVIMNLGWLSMAVIANIRSKRLS